MLPPGADGGGLQRIEVRAFGLLLRELLSHCSVPQTMQGLYASWAACIQANSEARPLMAEVLSALAELAAC